MDSVVVSSIFGYCSHFVCGVGNCLGFCDLLIFNGVARTLKGYAHQREITRSSSDSLKGKVLLPCGGY